MKARGLEVVDTWLRIEETLNLTHGHVREGRQQEYCMDCIVPLTVFHALIQYPNHSVKRL